MQNKSENGVSKQVFKKKANMKWTPLNNKTENGWFRAHTLTKITHDYVNTVKFMERENIWVTGTTNGEVKLWTGKECLPLGTLNSEKWNTEKIQKYVKAVLEGKN